MRSNSLRNASQLRDEQTMKKDQWLNLMARVKSAKGNRKRLALLMYGAQYLQNG